MATIPDTLLEKEITALKIKIKELANQLFQEPDYQKMLLNSLKKGTKARQLFLEDGWIPDDKYMNRKGKYYCSRAFSSLRLSEMSFDEGKYEDALSLLCNANFLYGVALTAKHYVDKYQKGPNNKSEGSQQKWELARKYLLEEIPKHKTLKKARGAAAARAGIRVEERQLIKMLPNPK